MVCKGCVSGHVVRLNAEFALTPETLRAVMQNAPLYLAGKAVVCLDCGRVEIKAPKSTLAALKRGREIARA
jgi:hypothetical protein